jgi:hypothetical protein
MAGRPIFMVGGMHSGSREQAERDFRAFRGPGAVADTFGPREYLALQRMADESAGWGHRFYTKSGYLPDFNDDVVDLCMREVESAPSGGEIGLWVQGGAMGSVPDDAMAFTGRNAPYNISSEVMWNEKAHDNERIAWGRATMAAFKPHMTTGRYVNEVTEAGTDLAQIYGKSKFNRLVGLKRTYDPDNFFRLNQNIKP